MKYIKELVNKISEVQFEKLTNSAFTETELKLLHYYRTSDKEETEEKIAENLGLKCNTLNKLQSKLVNDILLFFNPTNEIVDKISFLAVNNCHRIMLHIGRKEINQLIKNKQQKELAFLYKTLVYKLLSSIIDIYDIKEVRHFANAYKKLEPTEVLEYNKLYMVVLILDLMQRNELNEEEIIYFQNEIESLEIGDDVIALHWKNKFYMDFYGFIDSEKVLECIKANYDLVTQNESLFSENLIVNTKLMYCFYLLEQQQFEELYAYYFEIYRQHPHEKKGIRYVDLMAQLCIVLNKYDEARAFILESYPIENDDPGPFAEFFFGNTTILAMIDILQNKMEDAFRKISVAKIGLKKQYFIFLDSLLRLVEQAYFVKTKDFEMAEILHLKNLKFYQYHTLAGLEIMESAHKILNAYAKQAVIKKPLSTKYQAYFEPLSKGDYAFIGHFIQKVIAK